MSEVSEPGSFSAPTGGGDAAPLIAVLDIQATMPGVRRLRTWAREVLAPKPGEHAVDVGSGTGDELQLLATAVGSTGAATGVEPNPALLAESIRRAEESGSTAKFVPGNAFELPFDESTVDILRCERVWQHLDEPQRAADEVARVLRPGGRALVIDTDWATTIMHPGDLEVVEAMRQMWLKRFPNPFSGRKLAGQLSAAGLRVDDIGSQALIQDPRAIDTMLAAMTATASDQSFITEEQRDQLIGALRAGAASGDFHFSVTMFAVLASKPLT
jgi:ubiquinone/menaquinone biosynthesis C-methylase UbiE